MNVIFSKQYLESNVQLTVQPLSASSV